MSRPNRFAAWVNLGGEECYCHMPNPGRMWELLFEGIELWVTLRHGEGVTSHSVVLAQAPDSLVCLDSRLPPGLFHEALLAGLVPEMGDCPEMATEVQFGASRIDLRYGCDSGEWLVETKSCTLVVDGEARFPDAPTIRGTRHLRELAEARRQGMNAAAAFMIQRDDARVFRPNDETDPVFGQTLREVAAEGVEVFAILCPVSVGEVVPLRRLPVLLDAVAS